MGALRVTDSEYDALLLRQGKGQRASASPPVTKPNKYKAVKKWVGGHCFASTGEARRYIELSLLEKAGKILFLTLQKHYPIIVKEVTVCEYVADFVYYEDGKLIVEDFKGVRTAVYQLKKKLMRACYNVEIRESSAHR